jgi:nucleotide-binding universal stress UspA family protein
MEKRILLGIDPALSPATQQALKTISELLDGADTSFTLLLLHVIPTTHVVMEHPGHPLEQYILPPTLEQRKQAEEVLRKARRVLEDYNIISKHIETIVKSGTPPEEIVHYARERQVSLIVVGSRGNGWKQELRRFFLGSISRGVLKQAPCPVMVVRPPKLLRTDELVDWYEQAIKNYLKNHAHELMVLTPEQAAERFLPIHKMKAEQADIQATTTALERMESKGLLCRRDYQGMVRYIND